MAKQPPARRPSAAPPPPPAPKKSNSNVIILATVLTLVAFGCGFGALWVQAGLSQPVSTGCGTATQPFVVATGDGENTVIANLEKQHFIRNANILKIYLKIRGKTINALPSTYNLSPCWNIQQIIDVLNAPPSKAYVTFTVPEGDRLIQYPGDILGSAVLHDPGQPDDKLTGSKALPNFDTKQFLDITVNGTAFPEESAYWWIKPWDKKSGSLTALEGYLFPNTYQTLPSDDTVTIIKRMLKGFAELLCPDPSGASGTYQYIFDQTQCMANQAIIQPPTIPSPYQATVGKPIGIFDALKANKMTLQQAMILASLAQREARTTPNFFLVDSTYFNRWQDVGEDPFGRLGADPAEQYWLGTTAKAGSDPWATLPKSPTYLPDNPYNMYLEKGLPPSAISGPGKDALYGAIDIIKTNYRWFFFGCDNANHYYSDPTVFASDEQTIGFPGGKC